MTLNLEKCLKGKKKIRGGAISHTSRVRGGNEPRELIFSGGLRNSYIAMARGLKGDLIMFSDYRWFRKFKGGHWYHLRPYDNLYSFTHMRYWTQRKASSTEVVLKEEVYVRKD